MVLCGCCVQIQFAGKVFRQTLTQWTLGPCDCHRPNIVRRSRRRSRSFDCKSNLVGHLYQLQCLTYLRRFMGCAMCDRTSENNPDINSRSSQKLSNFISEIFTDI
ncbi:hypothetical protein ACOME3_009135 [Neoechinorhynchus agilis]